MVRGVPAMQLCRLFRGWYGPCEQRDGADYARFPADRGGTSRWDCAKIERPAFHVVIS